MRLLEHEAKGLLKEAGIATPRGEVVTTAAGAAAVAAGLGGRVVVKAQVPTGGRMKAGAVRFADSAEEARAAAGMLGGTVRDYAIEAVLVEERLAAGRELFVAVTYAGGRAVVLAAEGGIEVESEGRVATFPFSTRTRFAGYQAREVAAHWGLSGRGLLQAAAVVEALVGMFLRYDALLVEVNPLLVLEDGRLVAADAHVEIDDDALYRQRGLAERFGLAGRAERPLNQFEQAAVEIDRADHRGVAGRMVQFPGRLGLLIGGGGASLTVFDAVLDAGLEPANYCEIGGNPSVGKVAALTELILRQPGVTQIAVIMNVVSNTRVDLVARGVIKGVLAAGRDPRSTVVAFRVPGSWEDEGVALLSHYGVPYLGRDVTLDRAVALIKERLA